MKQFTPTLDEVKNLQAERSVGLIDAKSILTGRKVMAELQNIHRVLDNTPDVELTVADLKEELTNLVEIITFMVSHGSIKF